MIRFLILCAIFLGSQNNLMAIELLSSIHQPQTSFRYVSNKKIGLKLKGTLKKENKPKETYDENFIDKDLANNVGDRNYFGLDAEVFQSNFSNIGMFFEVEIPETEPGKKFYIGSIRTGGFFRAIAPSILGFSPFVRFDASIGASVMTIGLEPFGGNVLKVAAAGGVTYYFSQFYGVEFAYGYGLEYSKLFEKGNDYYYRLTDISMGVGLKTTFF